MPPVRVAIDLNVCTGGWRPIPGYEELQRQRLLTRSRLSSADGPVAGTREDDQHGN